MSEKKKELTIELSDEVRDKMNSDPELATVMKELFANFHQAFEGVQSGQYKSMEDAMEAITGNRPEPIGPDDFILDEEDKDHDKS